MKIVLPVKQVAALDDDYSLEDDGSVDPAALEWEVNEWDTFSLEAALQLHEAAADGGDVVVLTVGDEEAEEGLRSALAKGAHRAVRIWDDDLEDADPLVVARVLAAAVEREEPDLVLCGVQSSDAVNSATGIALAGFLGLSRVAVVKGIERQGPTLTLERELEGGTVELLEVELPVLLTIQTGINEPRYATLRAIKQAQDKPLAVHTPAEIGLDGAELARVAGARRRRLAPPDVGGGAQILSGSAPEVAAQIVEIVKERVG